MKRLHTRLGLPALLAAILTPTAWAATFTHTFSPDTVAEGAASRLVYTITNSGPAPITNLAFSNNLPTNVTIADAPATSNDCMGNLSAPANGATITYDNGRLGSGQSCTIALYVAPTAVGTHTNVTGDLTGSDGNSGTSTDNLTVDPTKPIVDFSLADASIMLGASTLATLTLDNSANVSLVSNIATSFTLPESVQLTSDNFSNTCTGTVTPNTDTNTIAMNNIAISGNSSCTITFDVLGKQAAVADIISSPITSSVVGDLGYANAALEITGTTLTLGKTFAPASLAPGASTQLTYTITNNNRSANTTSINFTDDYDTALTGLTSGAIVNGCGGSVVGGSALNASGITLAAGASCNISVQLTVPGGALANDYTSTTSVIAGTSSVAVIGNAASATLRIANTPVLTKSFVSVGAGIPVTDVASGDQVALRFTLSNPGTTDITGFTLTELVSPSLFQPTALPANGSCGGGSTFSAPFLLDVYNFGGSNLSVVAGDSCSFDLILAIPNTASTGTAETGTDMASYEDASRTIDATVITDTVTIVAGVPVVFSVPSEVILPGDILTIEFNLGGGAASEIIDQDVYDSYSNIAFSLDLDAALTGLVAIGLPLSNPCGPGSSATGTNLLTVSGGNLSEGQSCSFTIQAQVPGGAPAGEYTLTPSLTNSTVRGVAAISDMGSVDFVVSALQLSLSVTDDPVMMTTGNPGTATLEFTLNNALAGLDATNITFQLNLSSAISGMTVTGLPVSDVCGAGSQVAALSGDSRIILISGNLIAGASCTFSATVRIPDGTATSFYSLVTNSVSATIGGSSTGLPNVAAIIEVVADGDPRDLTPEQNLSEPDADGDGILTAIEQPLGDVNGDGLLDALQSNVASIVNPVTGRPSALSFDLGCTLNAFTMVAANSLPADNQHTYPDGLASFDLSCEASDITLTLPGGNLGTGYSVRKYGPIAPDFGGASSWYPVAATIDSANDSFSFFLEDAELGDSTGDDGRLVDPVGVAAASGGSGLPVNNPWALLLTAFALLSTIVVLRKRLLKPR